MEPIHWLWRRIRSRIHDEPLERRETAEQLIHERQVAAQRRRELDALKTIAKARGGHG